MQIWLLVSVSNLLKEAEAELARSEHARNISDAITTISRDGLDLVTTSYSDPETATKDFSNDPVYRDLIARVSNDFDKLDKLTAEDPAIRKSVADSKKAARETLQNLLQIQASKRRAGNAEHGLQEELWRKTRKSLGPMLYNQELLMIGEEQRKLAERSPQMQSVYREQEQKLLIGMGIFDLLVAIFGALLFARAITLRLERMADNTVRFASGLPLYPVAKGSDEIPMLDAAFHQMASELRIAARKEKAVLANARDLICSLDENGRIVQINPAGMELLAMTESELSGRYVIDLVDSEDASKTLAYMESLKSANRNPGPVEYLEIKMRTGTGGTVHVEWSGHWSNEENLFFIVVHDVSERIRAEALRRDVMAMITHDLKTPLMTIVNILHFFDRGVHAKFEEEGTKLVKSASRSADRMMVLISDMLDLEKINAGMMELDLEDVALQECFLAAREDTEELAREKGITINMNETDIALTCDERRISRVLNNLISNAIKFSPRGSAIDISAKLQGNFAYVCVKDRGEGVPEHMQEAIFDRYRQVKAADSAKKGGTGLGLAICKSIVELHGGKIWVKSEPGEGSEFTFTLPAENASLEGDE